MRGRRHVEHRNQHQDRTEQRIKEEFVARLDPLGAAPDPDDEVHRDQTTFEEHIEQEQVLSCEKPMMSDSISRKMAHIFGTRLVIARQLAPMQIGIRNT